MKENFYLAHDS